LYRADPLQRQGRRIAGEGIAVLTGIAMLAGAWLIDDGWTARHFPPDFNPPYGLIEDGVRIARVILALCGAALIFAVRRHVGSALARPRSAASIALVLFAIASALGAAELILRSTGWNAVLPPHMETEPLRQYDPILGWTLIPSHSGVRVTAGRTIPYFTDPYGYREPDSHRKPDFARPAILFAGESIMSGRGLTWQESIPAQVGSLLNVQAVDISVRGYATDQNYLRLKAELRRFRRPIAVVLLFSPMLFRRNCDDGRPHLGPDLVWRPAATRWRLATLARRVVPYRSEAEIRRCILTTRAILRAVAKLARARGAAVIIFVPQFMPENQAERLIRKQVLSDMDVPMLPVALDPRWRLPNDSHPNARAAHVMAVAIAHRLKSADWGRSGSSLQCE